MYVFHLETMNIRNYRGVPCTTLKPLDRRKVSGEKYAMDTIQEESEDNTEEEQWVRLPANLQYSMS